MNDNQLAADKTRAEQLATSNTPTTPSDTASRAASANSLAEIIAVDKANRMSQTDEPGKGKTIPKDESSHSSSEVTPVDSWLAPVSSGPLDVYVQLPGSKSQTSRALVIATIADRPVQIRGALAARDTLLAAAAMQSFGAKIAANPVDLAKTTDPAKTTNPADKINTEDATAGTTTGSKGRDTDTLVVTPPVKLQTAGQIDCGLAGTVMRFGPALAAFANNATDFDGDEAAKKRPLAPLLAALTDLGANVEYFGQPGFLPFQIQPIKTFGANLPTINQFRHSTGLPVDLDIAPNTKVLQVDTTTSSQHLSALLLASPLFSEPVVIVAQGKLPSRPYVQMSVKMLQDQGIKIRQLTGTMWLTDPSRPQGKTIQVEPDLSNAGPFLAAALVCGGCVKIPNWPTETNQVGQYWVPILRELGAKVELKNTSGETTLVVSAPAGHRWPGVTMDMSAYGELAPTLAALCVLADSPSQLTGIGHLRGHETNRLAAIVTEIRRVGGQAQELPDGLQIIPLSEGRKSLQAATLHSYADHRMGTFGAILGLAIPGVRVQDIECTAKTLPDFPKRWQAMLAGVSCPPPLSLAAALPNNDGNFGVGSVGCCANLGEDS